MQNPFIKKVFSLKKCTQWLINRVIHKHVLVYMYVKFCDITHKKKLLQLRAMKSKLDNTNINIY